jgi:hypothetical protein
MKPSKRLEATLAICALAAWAALISGCGSEVSLGSRGTGDSGRGGPDGAAGGSTGSGSDGAVVDAPVATGGSAGQGGTAEGGSPGSGGRSASGGNSGTGGTAGKSTPTSSSATTAGGSTGTGGSTPLGGATASGGSTTLGGSTGVGGGSGIDGGTTCDCAGGKTTWECYCSSSNACDMTLSSFLPDAGTARYSMLEEYATCGLIVVTSRNSALGIDMYVFDLTSGRLVGRKITSDTPDRCPFQAGPPSMTLSAGQFPDSTCVRSKCLSDGLLLPAVRPCSDGGV